MTVDDFNGHDVSRNGRSVNKVMFDDVEVCCGGDDGVGACMFRILSDWLHQLHEGHVHIVVVVDSVVGEDVVVVGEVIVVIGGVIVVAVIARKILLLH